jgi:hypothetical protein
MLSKSGNWPGSNTRLSGPAARGVDIGAYSTMEYIRAEPAKRAEDEFNLGDVDCTANIKYQCI